VAEVAEAAVDRLELALALEAVLEALLDATESFLFWSHQAKH